MGAETASPLVVAINHSLRESYGMSDRAWAVYTDQSRRTDEAVAEVIRIAVAEELRRLAVPYRENAAQERRRANRLANGAPMWQYEASITSYQELAAVARRLTARADELDPEGAQR